jgi:hypothetical protein
MIGCNIRENCNHPKNIVASAPFYPKRSEGLGAVQILRFAQNDIAATNVLLLVNFRPTVTLPDPAKYLDGVQFFRDTHKLVLRACADLEDLLKDAETRGVFASFAARPEWNSVFEFFLKIAPQHERDEERFLFPVVAAKLPRIGFQQPDAPIRFLIEGHDVMQRETIQLVDAWKTFRSKDRDPATLASSHEDHAAEDAGFIALGHELASLYRDHIATEEARIYSVADKVLTGTERLALIERLQSEYDNEAMTTIAEFEPPQYSNPAYNVSYLPTEAVADAEFEEEEDEDE